MKYKILVETRDFISETTLSKSEKIDISMSNKELLTLLQSQEQFKGIPITNIVNARTHHQCKYCGRITKGSYKNLLCDECKEVFGHSVYSEL